MSENKGRPKLKVDEKKLRLEYRRETNYSDLKERLENKIFTIALRNPEVITSSHHIFNLSIELLKLNELEKISFKLRCIAKYLEDMK